MKVSQSIYHGFLSVQGRLNQAYGRAVRWGSIVLLCPAALLAGPPAIDTFYTPLPEDQGLTMLRSIFTQSGCSSSSPEPTNPVTTYLSIRVLRD